MSAPAIKLRPAPINTIALTAGAALPLSSAATMPSGTPGDIAFTGGLSTVMIPISPSFSNRTSSPSAILDSLHSNFHNETARQRDAGAALKHQPSDAVFQNRCVEV